MLAEAAQVDGLAVQQEVAVLDLKGTDTDSLCILVHHGFAIGDADHKVVQVRGMDVPQLDIVNVQGAGFAFGMGDLFGAVQHVNADRMTAVGGHSIVCLKQLTQEAARLGGAAFFFC